MELYFKDKDLFEIVNDPKKRVRQFGALRAKLLMRRLQALSSADRPEQLKGLPGRFHELKGNRRGQWACDLDQPYRLIFKPMEKVGDNIGVIVIEIVNYH